MSDEQEQTAPGAAMVKRGPSFPFIGLERAVERAQELYAKAKRFEVRLADAAADWGYAPKSSGAFQTAAALISYGLLEDTGSGDNRKVKVSDLGWRILEDKRPGAREELLAQAALRPKLISEFAELWREGRPDDSHAISDLKFDWGFTDESAPRFLKVFDDAIRFTKPSEPDTHFEPAKDTVSPFAAFVGQAFGKPGGQAKPAAADPDSMKGIALMQGERELTTGILSKDSSFRLIVSGHVGEKEIERLIKKLELDKEILADAEDDDAGTTVNLEGRRG